MTMPDRGAPKGAPRGTAAPSEVVEVYKILSRAGEPLTVPQIAEKMPKGYLNAAMVAYREYKEQTDPFWLEGKGTRWSAGAQREAMTWWVRRIVQSGVHTKKFSVKTRPVQNMTGRTREGTYTPGQAPKVRRVVWVERPALVEWSPEHDSALNTGHSAGIQYLALLDEYRSKHKSIPREVRDLLDLAERAIRVHQ